MPYPSPAERQLGFRIHASVFVPSLIAVFVINYLTGAPYWAVWVLLGWGTGLLAHWFFVLGPGAGKLKQGDRAQD
jgi:uncharacterized membrane protein